MRATGRKNLVQDRPKLAGIAGARARLRKIRREVASFPEIVLTALNIGYCPGIEDDPNVLIEALTIREADIPTRSSGTTILGRVTAKDIQKARTLVAIGNLLGPHDQLPFHIAYSVIRRMANKIIQGNPTGRKVQSRSLHQAKNIALNALYALRFTVGLSERENEKSLPKNLELAKFIILSFDPDAVPPGALSRLRRCEKQQCQKPYFIQRSIRRAKRCPTHSK